MHVTLKTLICVSVCVVRVNVLFKKAWEIVLNNQVTHLATFVETKIEISNAFLFLFFWTQGC